MEEIGFYSLKDVQRILKVPRWRISYLYEAEVLPEPRMIGGHRLFTDSDVKALASKLGITLESSE